MSPNSKQDIGESSPLLDSLTKKYRILGHSQSPVVYVLVWCADGLWSIPIIESLDLF